MNDMLRRGCSFCAEVPCMHAHVHTLAQGPQEQWQAASLLRRRTIMDRMRNATFCLSMPGDSASTRRLSETIMAGCIPVFLGPPYASMPMAGDVRYRDIGVFFNITGGGVGARCVRLRSPQ